MNNPTFDAQLAQPQLNQPLVAPIYETIEPSQPVIARPADGRSMDIPGHTTRLQLSSAQTGGRLAVLSCELAPDYGPPPHRHTHEDEIFIVQSGSIEFFLNGEYLVATAGDVIFVSRGEAHGFRGLEGAEPNRLMGIAAPGRNFETFYDGLVELANTPGIDMSQVTAHGHKHGMTMFPPHAPVEIPIVKNSRSKVVRAGTKRVLDVVGGKVQILLSTQDTGGAYGLIYIEGAFNDGPPPHVHQREDETFFIERGSLEMWLNGETQIAQAGDISWSPRHVPHTFRVASEEGASGWVLLTPAGFDNFFRDCAELQEANNATPESMTELGAKYDLTFLPPA